MSFRGMMGRLQRKKDQSNKTRKKKNSKSLSLEQYRKKEVVNLSSGVLSKDRKKYENIVKSSSRKRDNFFKRAFLFFKESKLELKRVVWPSRKQTVGSTLVVITIVCLISLFLGVVDTGLSGLIRLILG